MKSVEKQINSFLEKYSTRDTRKKMNIDLHLFIRIIIKEHDKIMDDKAYTPQRKHNQ